MTLCENLCLSDLIDFNIYYSPVVIADAFAFLSKPRESDYLPYQWCSPVPSVGLFPAIRIAPIAFSNGDSNHRALLMWAVRRCVFHPLVKMLEFNEQQTGKRAKRDQRNCRLKRWISAISKNRMIGYGNVLGNIKTHTNLTTRKVL